MKTLLGEERVTPPLLGHLNHGAEVFLKFLCDDPERRYAIRERGAHRQSWWRFDRGALLVSASAHHSPLI